MIMVCVCLCLCLCLCDCLCVCVCACMFAHSCILWQHLMNLLAKMSAQVALICNIACTTWGALTKTLCISTQVLVFSATEYCVPVWYRSAHTQKLYTTLNNALWAVSGCLHVTLTPQLKILASITTQLLWCKAAVLALFHKATINEDHLLHRTAAGPHPAPSAINICKHIQKTLAQTALDGGVACSRLIQVTQIHGRAWPSSG